MSESSTESALVRNESQHGVSRLKRSRGSRQHFGVEPLGDGGFRIASVQASGGRVSGYDFAEIHSPSDAKTVLRRLHYRKSAETVLTLPRREAILKWVHLPSTDPKQIAQMIPHEARVLAPWTDQEGSYSYRLYETDEKGCSSVLIMLVRRDTVEKYLAQLRELGVVPTRFEISTVSLGRLVEGIDPDERPAIARTDSGGMEFSRYWNGTPLFSRGATDESDLLALVRDSMELDERKHGIEDRCTTLVVASEAPEEQLRLSQYFPDSHVVSLGEFRAPILNGVQGMAAEEMACIGAAMGAEMGEAEENLLPEAEQQRLALRVLLLQAGKSALLLTIILSLLYALGTYFLGQEQSYAAQARAEIEALREQVGDLDIQSSQLRLLQNELSSIALPLEVVLELYERTPSAVAINHMHYDSRGALILGGEASGFQAVNDFLTALNQSDIFDNVELSHSSTSHNSNAQFVDFRLTAKVKQ